jgi:hypothetical protein
MQQPVNAVPYRRTLITGLRLHALAKSNQFE